MLATVSDLEPLEDTLYPTFIELADDFFQFNGESAEKAYELNVWKLVISCQMISSK